jgi:hypothetical protein
MEKSDIVTHLGTTSRRDSFFERNEGDRAFRHVTVSVVEPEDGGCDVDGRVNPFLLPAGLLEVSSLVAGIQY